jgi:pimeloyl-ACP methyl ester carboxylesterase
MPNGPLCTDIGLNPGQIELEDYIFKSLISNTWDLKRDIPWTDLWVAVIIFILCFITMGCTLIRSKHDADKTLESTVIVGRIDAKSREKGPIIVAACSTHGPKVIANYTVLHETGEYELMVPQGNYSIFAYRDKNSNLIYDQGEPAGQHGPPKSVRAQDVGIVFDIDMVIPEKGSDITIPYGTKISSIRPQKLHSRQAGAITDLDDELFAEENGVKGFWEPNSFFKEMGGNIYFLEAYDPDKIPILFIHGATGTPRGWKYFVNHIDRKRFQPWFFYYPSGSRLNSMSYLLFWKLANLQSKYHFNEIYITAHSMGGLIARSFIVNYGQQLPYVKLFISLATPWGGDKMAEYGVQQSPVVIPSWRDMQPEGDFIKSLYHRKLPESVSFYMFIGYKGNRNPIRSNNDGTIALSSLLDFRPQSEAKMNYSFNEDHVSIVFSKEVLSQYNTILDTFDETPSASSDRSGGYLKVRFAYDYEIDGVMPLPMFVLRPVDEKEAETVTWLGDTDNGKIFGPYPTGKYFASMLTAFGRTTIKSIPVTIESNTTKELKFVLIPDGEIRGYVTSSLKPQEKYVGRPDIVYRSADKNINIQSVTLTGSGVQRRLQPMPDENVNAWDLFTSRTDFCIGNFFVFFGLPAGEYSVFIKANGHSPIEKKYAIVPGIPINFRATELTPE